MPADLLVFLGYSSEAKNEAAAVAELIPFLQDRLRGFNDVSPGRLKYSHVQLFDWESDSDIGVGGQDMAIGPHLRRAAIAIFIFKSRVGTMTRQELESCRNRPPAERIPALAVFKESPPSRRRMADQEVARAWADLVTYRDHLTAEWGAGDSRAVTPVEAYRNKEHLKEILRERLLGLLPAVIVPHDSPPWTEHDSNSQAVDPRDAPLSFLDSSTALIQHDAQAVEEYRRQLRKEVQGVYPHELSAEEFLLKAGYARGGRLTMAGMLLFSATPSSLLPSAFVRCSKYEGDTKAGTARTWQNCDGPLLSQILDARKFLADNMRRRELPVDTSQQPAILYEYPMKCVRELLANAVCHRDYEDLQRFVIVTLFDNRLEIKSPGPWSSRPLPEGRKYPLSMFIGESVQRNMRLAHAISAVGMMEVEGSGIPAAVADCATCGAPEPIVEFRDGYVCITVFPQTLWDTQIADSPVELQLDQPSLVTVPQPQREFPRPAGPRAIDVAAPTPLEIASDSPAMKLVLEQVEQVARTPSTVLLLGETGTGKELIAEAIHNLSPRSQRPMVRVSCAAIPTTLIESELFGRERGAFTGALSRQVGRFEAATHSTLFLDEIGELPMEVQVKLLRVLQERVVERLGSSQAIKVDVRIIAATNRNLQSAVEQKTFREDLYYRLNVFPIVVPPLRERVEDIAALVWSFVDEFSKSFDKAVDSISSDTMRELQRYPWPGNVRELRNVIERAVISSTGRTLVLPSRFGTEPTAKRHLAEMADIEVAHIRAVLESTNWRIRGSGGAAERLGLKPTTLQSRMARLGIKRPS